MDLSLSESPLTIGFPIPEAMRSMFRIIQGFSLALSLEQTPHEEAGGHKSGHAFLWSTLPLARADLQSQMYPSHAFSATLDWGC